MERRNLTAIEDHDQVRLVSRRGPKRRGEQSACVMILIDPSSYVRLQPSSTPAHRVVLVLSVLMLEMV